MTTAQIASEVMKAIDNKDPDALKLAIETFKQNPTTEQESLTAFLDLTCVNPYNSNALYMACRAGSLPCVQILVEHGASVNLPFPRHAKGTGSSCLHIAAYRFYLPICAYLCVHGAKMTARNAVLDTPLLDALDRKPKDTYGLDESMLPLTPLHNAIVYQVIRNTLPNDHPSSTPLRRLCQQPHLTKEDEVEMQSLLTNGHVQEEALAAPQGTSWNCIHAACAHGNDQALKILLKMLPSTANVLTADHNGWSPLNLLIGRSTVCPSESSKLREMAQWLIAKDERVLFQSTLSEEIVLRPPLIYRMFTGMITYPLNTQASTPRPEEVHLSDRNATIKTNFTMFVRHAQPCDEDDVLKYAAWVWMNNNWKDRRQGVLTFWPRSGRRVLLTFTDRTTLLSGFRYDDAFDVIRDAAEHTYDLTEPQASDMNTLYPVPTCLSCHRNSISREIMWNIPALPDSQPFEFSRLIQLSIQFERYEVIQQGRSRFLQINRNKPSYFNDEPEKSFDKDFFGLVGVSGSDVGINPTTVPHGSNPITWIVRYFLSDWYQVLPNNILSHDEFARKDVISAAIQLQWSEFDNAERSALLENLKKIGAIKPADKVTGPAT
eukprot:PhF_6_TR38638/c0_g1_i2/m.57681